MPFRYFRDPLWLAAVALYFLNRVLLKPHVGAAFFRDHLNDLLCIPIWVPVMVWLMRRSGLRRHDAPPGAGEIVIPLVVWSAVFELWLPTVTLPGRPAVADPHDILWYAVGGCVAATYWRFRYRAEERGEDASRARLRPERRPGVSR